MGALATLQSMQTLQTCPESHGSAACYLDATSCATPSTTKASPIPDVQPSFVRAYEGYLAVGLKQELAEQ